MWWWRPVNSFLHFYIGGGALSVEAPVIVENVKGAASAVWKKVNIHEMHELQSTEANQRIRCKICSSALSGGLGSKLILLLA